MRINSDFYTIKSEFNSEGENGALQIQSKNTRMQISVIERSSVKNYIHIVFQGCKHMRIHVEIKTTQTVLKPEGIENNIIGMEGIT